jgi:hypothetical protein
VVQDADEQLDARAEHRLDQEASGLVALLAQAGVHLGGGVAHGLALYPDLPRVRRFLRRTAPMCFPAWAAESFSLEGGQGRALRDARTSTAALSSTAPRANSAKTNLKPERLACAEFTRRGAAGRGDRNEPGGPPTSTSRR